MTKAEKHTKSPNTTSEVVDLRLQRAFARFEKAFEGYKLRAELQPSSEPDAALIRVLEQRIESLQGRLDFLEQENSNLKKQLEKSEPFFETVKQKSQPSKKPVAKNENLSSGILSQVKNLFDDD